MKRVLACGVTCLIVAAAVSACQSSGPGNETAYQQGSSSCSFDFVNDYNQVGDQVNATTGLYGAEKLDNAQSLVNQFSAKYQGVVCVANLTNVNTLDSIPTTIDVNATVKDWNSELDQVRSRNGIPTHDSNGSQPSAPSDPSYPSYPIATQTPEPAATPSAAPSVAPDPVPTNQPSPQPAATHAPALTAPGTLTLEVVDSAKFNEAIKAGYAFQKGATYLTASDGAEFCNIFKSARLVSAPTFNQGDRLTFDLSLWNGTSILNGTSQDKGLVLVCYKSTNFSSHTSWAPSEFPEIFGEIARANAS